MYKYCHCVCKPDSEANFKIIIIYSEIQIKQHYIRGKKSLDY